MDILSSLLEKKALTLEDELDLKRSKHHFVQWLVGGNRRSVPKEAKPFLEAYPEEAKALFDRYRQRARKKQKVKMNLFLI